MDNQDLKHIYDSSLFNISDLDVLLHEILKHTRELIQTEAGTIYIKEKDYLKFHIFQNDKLSYENIYRVNHSFKNFQFPLEKQDKYISVDSYINKKIIVVNDVYNNETYDFMGIREFDAKFSYKTQSIITVPLVHPFEPKKVLGVIQLINKHEDGEFIDFGEYDETLLTMFASFISLSITKAQNDVLKLQEANDLLKQANEKLEMKLSEQTFINHDMQEVIFHQSKMASMGEVIGQIANQWKKSLNKISTLTSGVSLDIQMDLDSKEDSVVKLNKIIKTTQNLSSMIDDFKFFYNIETIKEKFNLKEAIEQSLDITRMVLHNNKIELVLKLDDSLEVYGLKNEFIQMLLNLLTNAKENLIRNNLYNEKKIIFVDLYKDNENIVVKITDNAKCVNSDVIKNILSQEELDSDSSNDFTLGIFMSKLIVQSHMNGLINFENISFSYKDEDYEGNQFKITLA